MRQEQFLNDLERLLFNIPKEEREEAMAFYRSYFEDAGENNEENIISELESPEKVAKSIRESLSEEESGTAKERYGQNLNYWNGANTANGTAYAANGTAYAAGGAQYANQAAYAGGAAAKESNTGTIVLAIILLVVTSPIWLGLLSGVFGVIIGFVAIVAALLVAGCVVVVASFVVMTAGEVAAGLITLGVGFLLLAFGILGLIATVWLFGTGVPAMCRGIGKLAKKIAGK